MPTQLPTAVAASTLAFFLCSIPAGGVTVGVDNPFAKFVKGSDENQPGVAAMTGASASATIWTWTVSITLPLASLQGCAPCQSARTPVELAAAALDAAGPSPCNPGVNQTDDSREARHLIGEAMKARLELDPPTLAETACGETLLGRLSFPLREATVSGPGQSLNVPDLGVMEDKPDCHAYQGGFLGPWYHQATLKGTIHTTTMQAELSFLALEAYAEGKCTVKNLKHETLTSNMMSCTGQVCLKGFLAGSVLELPYCGEFQATASGFDVDAAVIDAGVQIGWDVTVDGTITIPLPTTANVCASILTLHLEDILQVHGAAFGIGV